ncbi:MAG: chemotaxis protein CheX [Acidobacteriaceae bacterium]
MRATALEAPLAKSRDGWMDDSMVLLDAAVMNIFALMLGMPCLREQGHSQEEDAHPWYAGGAAVDSTSPALPDSHASTLPVSHTPPTSPIAHAFRTSNTSSDSALEHVAAIVGFVGVMRGACVLRVGEAGARRMTGRMLGTEEEQMDFTVADAVGEVCNMVAGGWKSQVAELSAGCLLSVPAVISGKQHRIHASSQSQRHDRMYWFDGHPVHFTLVCEPIR